MSDKANVHSTVDTTASDMTAREPAGATEGKGSVNNGGSVHAIDKSLVATGKETNGTSETVLQALNPTTKSEVDETDVETKDKEEALPADDIAAESTEIPVAATPSSAKSKSRRKSGGVPEHHKSKKSNKKGAKATIFHVDAQPGDYFYIRLKGYPLWPGIVCSEDMLPSTLLNTRPVTAARADGTYRDDYEDDGKKINDRTFPVMYLSTQEFGWIPNFDLVEIDLDEVGPAADKIKNQQLANAHRLAAEKHDLQHWKTVLIEFKEAVEAEFAAKTAATAAKAEAKAAAKGKRKSKAAVDAEEDANGDIEMIDAPDLDAVNATEKKPKASKKRKAIVDAEESNDTPARPESLKKLKLKVTQPKTPNGNATPKSTKKDQSEKKSAKSKSKKATNGAAAEPVEPKEPELTPEEKLAKKEKEIMFLRHKLQKGLLTRDAQPKEEEMKQMSDYITKLEEHTELEIKIMKVTKINKVLKAILKLEAIPKEAEFKFKDRSQTLLNAWNKILGAEQPGATTPGPGDKVQEKELTNGSSKIEDKAAEPESTVEEEPSGQAPEVVKEVSATESTSATTDATNKPTETAAEAT